MKLHYQSILFFLLASFNLVAQSKSEVVTSVLVLEAADQGKSGMQAVFEVLRNRSKSNQIDSIYAQARKPKQFSCLNSLSDFHAINKAKLDKSWAVASQIVRSKIKSNLTHGATHYHASWIATPYWAKGRKVKVKIGSHIFY